MLFFLIKAFYCKIKCMCNFKFERLSIPFFYKKRGEEFVYVLNCFLKISIFYIYIYIYIFFLEAAECIELFFFKFSNKFERHFVKQFAVPCDRCTLSNLAHAITSSTPGQNPPCLSIGVLVAITFDEFIWKCSLWRHDLTLCVL